MRKLLILLILFLTVFLSGCSLSCEMLVFNESNDQIEIIIKPKKNTFEKPQQISKENWELNRSLIRKLLGNGENPFTDLSENEMNYNEKTNVLTLKIQPKQVVLIEQRGWGGSETSQEFYFEQITVSGKNGAVIYQGDNLSAQMQKESTTYFIKYK
jgi:hypothetical protein